MSVVDLEAFRKRADTAEEDIAILKNKLILLEESLAGNACNSFQKCGVSREEYLKLQAENTQLKHRIAILLRTVRDERAKHKSLTTMSDPDSTIKRSMPSVCGILRNIFQSAINCAYPKLINPHVDITSTDNPIFGDYQCNSAMSLSKQISSGTKVNCRDVAKNIVTHIKNCLLIEKVEIAGPGFINVFISRSYVASILSDVIQATEVTPPLVNKLKVIVDFSSPNIAKEMHVGHLRSTIIGDSIARLLEYLGHDVLRLNHVGDWGTQFGMLIAHLQDKFPDYLSISPPISDLQSFYKESKTRFDAEEEFKKRAYTCVVKLQSFDSNMIKAWQLICDVSRKEFAKVYDRLNIKIIERGESFYQTKMKSLVKELMTKGLLEEDEGRKIMWASTPPSGVPLTIVKSDGGFTYDTSDLAAIKQRLEEENAQWIIYVTDAGQSLHFHTVVECAKRVGILTNQRIDHVGFGVVLGEDKKKFKTRSGDTVKLSELLDEGLRRAKATIVEKGRDKVLSTEELKLAQEAVAYGCIKYADLAHNRNHEYVFSFDKMLEDKGNTAVYLLYALTRIKSIARIANISKLELQKLACQSPISLDHEKEFKLAKILVKFPDVLLKIANDLYLNHLCDYCFNVACSFAEFYDSCYCIEKNKEGEIIKVNVGRILLVEATEMILEKCFFILGLTPVARM